jgi:hypothetical protein
MTSEPTQPDAQLTDRVRFCRYRLGNELSESALAGVGTITSVREAADE